ncbi:hypothetical protein Ddc_12163 [Ditylenchus destructor]|nr:hypothetical protein Ddc_12163 [Ditylenchus destructor]
MDNCKKYSIFFSIETLAEILRYITRKELSLTLNFVNRQFYQLSNSTYHVPTTHPIKEICFERETHEIIKKSFFCISKPKYDYNIRIEPDDNSGSFQLKTSAQFLNDMPTPGPFIRFRKVSMSRCVQQSMVKFLCDANESFIGCQLCLYLEDYEDTDNMDEQVNHLLQNAFRCPSWVIFNGLTWQANKQSLLHTIVMREEATKCCRLELHHTKSNELDRMSGRNMCQLLLHWIRSDTIKNSSNVARKHLILRDKIYTKKEHVGGTTFYDIVRELRQDFENANNQGIAEALLDFVITFVDCGGMSSRNGIQILDPEFTVVNSSTGEKMSYISHGGYCKRVYRLWRRRVVNEIQDSMLTYYLRNPREMRPPGEFGLYGLPYNQYRVTSE